MKRLAALVAVAVLAAPGGAAAGSEPGPQIVDDCGDNGVVVAHDPFGDPLIVFAGDYGTDLQSGELHVVRPLAGTSMFTVTVGLCQGSSVPTHLSVSWSYGDGCAGVLTYDAHAASNQRTLSERCQVPGQVGASEVSSIALRPGEVAMSGSALTVRVPLSRIPTASQARFDPGTSWVNPQMYATNAPGGLSDIGVQVGDLAPRAGSGWDAASTSEYVVEPPE